MTFGREWKVHEALRCRYCKKCSPREEFMVKVRENAEFAVPNFCPKCGEGAMYFKSDVTVQCVLSEERVSHST